MDPATDPREPSHPMTPEANLFPAEHLPAVDSAQQHPPPAQATRTGIWLHRMSLVIFVIFCIELGMLLAALPWTRIWTDNSLLAAYPGLRTFVQNNFVRGVVSGIGLVDVWIGIWEAVHYRDPGKKKPL